MVIGGWWKLSFYLRYKSMIPCDSHIWRVPIFRRNHLECCLKLSADPAGWDRYLSDPLRIVEVS